MYLLEFSEILSMLLLQHRNLNLHNAGSDPKDSFYLGMENQLQQRTAKIRINNQIEMRKTSHHSQYSNRHRNAYKIIEL